MCLSYIIQCMRLFVSCMSTCSMQCIRLIIGYMSNLQHTTHEVCGTLCGKLSNAAMASTKRGASGKYLQSMVSYTVSSHLLFQHCNVHGHMANNMDARGGVQFWRATGAT